MNKPLKNKKLSHYIKRCRKCNYVEQDLWTKKGQGRLNIIIFSAIVIVVMIILWAIFTGRLDFLIE